MKSNLKKENYTAIADFMIVSFERDLADFTSVFKTIDANYLDAFKKANEKLKNVASYIIKKEEQKQATQVLYAKANEFREKLIVLKSYAKRANLNAPLLKETIEALKRKNIEKVIKNTREMLPYFTQNINKLTDMPADFLSDIPETITDLETKNTEQNSLMNEAKLSTAEKKTLYITLYKYISEVADAGKIVYKGNSKKDEYIISKILGRLDAGR